MSEAYTNIRSGGTGWLGGILMTVLIHGAFGVLFFLGHRRGPPPSGETRDLITTQLVKLGKPREKFWMPKIEQPRPTKQAEVIKITDDVEAPAAPPEAPKPENAQVADKLRNALNRARMMRQAVDEETDEGQLDGIREGTSSEAVTGDAYASQIFMLIRRNWNVPVGLISDDQLNKLSAQVKVQVAADGVLKGEAIVKSSGNATFDESCLQAVTATGSVPPPPADRRAAFARGVALLFKK